MMALKSPLSGTGFISAFSPFSDHPDSPRPRASIGAKPSMNSTDRYAHLATPSPSLLASPQDPVAPSPVASSIGTEFADTEGLEDGEEEEAVRQDASVQHKLLALKSPILKIDTASAIIRAQRRSDEDDAPQSVIHKPAGWGEFNRDRATTQSTASSTATQTERPEIQDARTTSSETVSSISSSATVTSPVAMSASLERPSIPEPISPPSLTTIIPNAPSDRGTPRAQTRQEVAALSRPGSSLASIMEGEDPEHTDTNDDTGDDSDSIERGMSLFRDADAEIKALKTALAECWTLCNTLASLSYNHRERIFNFSGKGDMEEQAWKACWKLCQNLYDTRDDYTISYVRPTLDLCRDFCQTLFEVRVRDNETADSVLRVSFELNNHLFNTHDRSLPEAFRERTLDFYLTLCHRLMKQKSRLADETDSLLKACWSLAEMLFSLRQNKRDGKKADEELLCSAVQACWELCDLFREGWTQIRPERATPRPSQTTFTQAFNQARRTGFDPIDDNANPKLFPETPTTIFEDTVTISPEEAPVSNILVFGSEGANLAQSQIPTSANPASNGRNPFPRGRAPASAPVSAHPHNISTVSQNRELAHNRAKWSSASAVHSYPQAPPSAAPSASSNLTTSTQHTITSPAEHPTLTLLKTLFVRAAQTTNRGFSRTSPDPTLNSLQTFVKHLPDTAFGPQSWQSTLLENYKKAVNGDPGFQSTGLGGVENQQRRGGMNETVEMARAVQGMVSCVYGFGWLKDLYRYVFGFYVEEALQGTGPSGVVGTSAGGGGSAGQRRMPPNSGQR